jgi:predicted amidohydrolase
MPATPVAAVQLDAAVADVKENLRRCEALADEAGRAGARWIVLPEFFTTGIGYLDRLADCVLPFDSAATQLLRDLAVRHGAFVGGSFLCRDPDGHNRNAFALYGPDGALCGRHDKDLPTMWENCYYVGGSDDGVIEAGPLTAGAALCWEFMRTQTPRRLRGRVDVVVGGSGWWSIPPWPPAPLTRRLEAANARTAAGIAPAMARLVGAPVIHAAHCGTVSCRLPWTPIPYQGHFQGHSVICDATGAVIARRTGEQGPGVVLAEIELGRVAPSTPLPAGFWLHKRGVFPALFWTYQNAHGRRWYAKHGHGRDTAVI